MMKTITIAEIAAVIGGDVIGDETLPICGAAAFETATDRQITYAAQAGFIKRLDTSSAGAVVIPEKSPCESDKTLIRVSNPEFAFSKILSLFYPKTVPAPGVHPGAVIDESAVLGADVTIGAAVVVGRGARLGDRTVIGPGTYIGDAAAIGDDVVIFPNTTIMERCVIGNRVVIHAGTVIGCDGFGYTREKNVYHKIPHIGSVRIDDDVEIGANNTIDRGRFGDTWIQQGVKTDNLVHVAHNVVVGENTVLVAQVGIAGSASIGKNVIVAGQAAVSGHLHVGDHAIVGPRAGVASSVESGAVVSGMGPIPHKLWLKIQKIMPRLPGVVKRLKDLEKRVLEIENTRP